MNCKIGFMSFVVMTSLVILFLLVSGKVEAKPKCIGSCEILGDCGIACMKKGYLFGQCVGWSNPNTCCCGH
ncbi:hypothetical protein ARALYDRAFT_317561 [Arabidopsis lyrata subsp. lyrata]|uniref:Uncharacterized protein n=1 Tax=Arabidopsis lyrata subsp. lyrata TaxID=81972 RepID=D7L617_ARALL|nr:putative defensin-like protein 73 [Arabidopsis lyrata subsp. lyrata]EFH58763.1 hypothetical protein ARALYDRAFT_317561 [Arabidopsis lyrata subsp. lyrata]|eukprot:XP_002882504.1 putative defensin-like protein 73 [Arabidopsis lyrata subsp. lyrata]